MKKKGFTLLELLGVIIILAIILVIAIPKILEVIENAEMQSYKESVELMVHTAKLQYQIKETQGNAPVIPEGGIIYRYGESGKDTIQTNINEVGLLDFKGDKPRSGTITLLKDKKVEVNKLVSKMRNGKYCAIKDKDSGVRVGKSSDPEFNCSKEIVDKSPCELEEGQINGVKAYFIDSVEDMYAFSDSVNSGTTYKDQIVKLRVDLDFSNYSKETKPTVCKENDNVDGFTPIGTYNSKSSLNRPFSGTFEGSAKTISNLIVDRPNQDYVGIFGNGGKIRGLTLKDSKFIGNSKVSSIAGYRNAALDYLMLENVEVYGNSDVGFISNNSEYYYNVLVKSGKTNGDIGCGTSRSGYVVNNMEAATGSEKAGQSQYCKYSNNTVIAGEPFTSGFNPKEMNDINFLDNRGINTWIGGSKDNYADYGYYFDYENPSSNNIVLKSVETDPMIFNLSGSGTKEDPYLIKNTNDWRTATIKPAESYIFKLDSDLDFSGKHFYMLGSNPHDYSSFNAFVGKLDGGAHTIKNVTINAPSANMLGIIGYLKDYSVGSVYNGQNVFRPSEVYGLNIENINITGNNYVGGLVGKCDGGTRLYEISLKNVNVRGNSGKNILAGHGGGNSVNGASVNNVLIKSGTSNGGAIYYYTGTNFYYSGSKNMVETADVVSNEKPTYYSSEYKINGVNQTPKPTTFISDKIDDLSFYKGKIETILETDSNETGYSFGYDEKKDGVYVVKRNKKEGWELVSKKEPLKNQKWVYWLGDGTIIQSGFQVLRDFSNNLQTYYFENGIAAVGFRTIDSQQYYFSEFDTAPTNNYVDANLIHDQTIVIDGVEYTFGDYGRTLVTLSTTNANEFSEAKEYALIVPKTGKYKLEVWGASGGSTKSTDSVTSTGGYGGYSVGYINLKKDDIVYANIGGAGLSSTSGKAQTLTGGYNGGGNAYMRGSSGTSVGSGGGATHIALISGTLDKLKSNVSKVLIVAAGGGGSHTDTDGNGYNSKGGNAGGYIGNNASQIAGTCSSSCTTYNYPGGGSQDAGGLGVTEWSSGTTSTSSYVGTFGKGASGTGSYGGGGSGLYGGGSGSYSGGGGGSSYISPSLSDAKMYCYDCTENNNSTTKTIANALVSESARATYSKIGSGYAKITFISD